MAGAIASGVGRVGREVAEEALRVAGRINGARDRVASELGYPVPGPGDRRSSRLPEDVLSAIGTRKPPRKVRPAEGQATGSRTPIAKSPSRSGPLIARRRTRKAASRTAS